MREVVLSLCDYTGIWGDQYADRYEVIKVDLQHGQDVRLFQRIDAPVRGVIAQPPCDHFAASGARWWGSKGESALLDGLQIVDACLRIIVAHRPAWWVLENPVGRLKDYLGPPVMTFNPCEYGGKNGDDPYTKRTCLWGYFTPPQKNPTSPAEGSKMHFVPPGPNRKNVRSATSRAFAEAFRMANP